MNDKQVLVSGSGFLVCPRCMSRIAPPIPGEDATDDQVVQCPVCTVVMRVPLAVVRECEIVAARLLREARLPGGTCIAFSPHGALICPHCDSHLRLPEGCRVEAGGLYCTHRDCRKWFDIPPVVLGEAHAQRQRWLSEVLNRVERLASRAPKQPGDDPTTPLNL